MERAARTQPPSQQHDDSRRSDDMSVGDILRRTREHYGYSTHDIENAIRIKAPQIAAIEAGDVENLPARVYAIGFVRAYAEYLRLDGEKIVQMFKEQTAGRNTNPQLDFPVAASDSKMPPPWLVLASVVMAFIVLFVLWSAPQDKSRDLVREIPPVPKELQIGFTDINSGFADPALDPLSSAAQSPPQTMEENGAIAEEQAPKGIILSITENSWVKIEDGSGKALVSRVLQAGDEYFVPDRPDLKMSIGNAGGVQIQVDGETLALLGEHGQVRRNIALNAQALKAQYSIAPDTKTIENIDE